MYNITNEFNFSYISKRVNLTWSDIDYGIKNKFIKPNVAVERAIFEINQKEDYNQVVFDLASLYKDESVYPYLTIMVDSELKIKSESYTKEKWMFLLLDWIYNNRDKYNDALDIVCLIYSDFDYPEQLAPFVKYMPSDEPSLGSLELSEARLYKKWYNYLVKQSEKFSK